MKNLLFLGIIAFSVQMLGEEHPDLQVKALNFLKENTPIKSYKNEDFQGEPQKIEFDPPAEVTRVEVNDPENPVIRYISPVKNLFPEPITTHIYTYEIYIYFSNGETRNCYISFFTKDDPRLSRCEKP